MSEHRRWIQPTENEHDPRWEYDCINCKFNWCCGYTCHCVAGSRARYKGDPLPEPPEVIQELVDAEMKAAGFEPQFNPRNRR